MKHTSGLVELPMHFFWMQTLHKTGIFCISSFKLGELLTSSSACLGGHDGSLSGPLLPVPTQPRSHGVGLTCTYVPSFGVGRRATTPFPATCQTVCIFSLFLLAPLNFDLLCFPIVLPTIISISSHQQLWIINSKQSISPKTETSFVEPASLVQSVTCVRNHQKRSSPVEPQFYPSG